MTTVTGIFRSPSQAEESISALKKQGFEEEQINILKRGESSFPVHAKQAGAAVGAVAGLSAVTFLPGLGPVIGLGMIASGLVGAALGAGAGKALERHRHGVPNEDLYFFEEAIRDGGGVVLVDARDATQETQARNLLERGGGRPAGATRRDWWQDLRDRERRYLQSRGRSLEAIEGDYRAGFEAALHPATRGRDYGHVAEYVETCYGENCRSDAFQLGYDRGQSYFRERVAARELE